MVPPGPFVLIRGMMPSAEKSSWVSSSKVSLSMASSAGGSGFSFRLLPEAADLFLNLAHRKAFFRDAPSQMELLAPLAQTKKCAPVPFRDGAPGQRVLDFGR